MRAKLILLTLIIFTGVAAQVKVHSPICGKLVKCDSSEYGKKKTSHKSIPRTTSSYKIKNSIRIPAKDSTIVFHDDKSEIGYSYNVAGEDKVKGWVLIEGLTPNESIYFVVSRRSNRIDTLIGLPQIYGDKIVCLEGLHTDSSWRAEIWQMEEDKLKLIRKFSLATCDIHGVDRIFLSGTMLFVSTHSSEYWRAKVLD